MSSDCAAWRARLARLESDPATPVGDELARHLDVCPDCRQHFDRGRVELDAAAFGAPDVRRRERVLDALARQRAGAGRRTWRGVAAAALVAAAGVAIWLAMPHEPEADRSVEVALVEDHIRYLGHPDRISGQSRTALEADLADYVDFPVALPAPPAARLTGVRRCYLLGRRVALAFYNTPSGPVSYFALAAADLPPMGSLCARGEELSCAAGDGYHVVAWRDAGLLHAFVGPDATALAGLARAARGGPDAAGAVASDAD